MTDVLLFHHAQGLTPGVRAIADRLRAAGHTVHLPDLYDGRTFDSLEDGLEYATGKDFGLVQQQGVEAAAGLPEALAVVGISLGVMPAQQIAQTRPGVLAAAFIASCLPAEEFGAWPAGVAVQVHGADHDEIFMEEGDVDAARELVAEAADGELFLYDAREHLFVDSSLPDHDAAAADLVVTRVLALLDRVA